MKKLLAILFTTIISCFPVFVKADVMVAQSPDGNVKVVLMQEPCTDKVSKQIFEDQGLTADFKAVVVVKGKNFEACWTVNEDVAPGVVLIADESGDAGMLPQEVFHKEKGL